MRELAPERRRRLIFRALPAVGVRRRARARRRDDGRLASARPRSEQTAARLRRGLGARRHAARCTRCSTSAHARRIRSRAFRRAYARSAATATVIRVRGAASPRASATARWRCPSTCDTRVFGVVRGALLGAGAGRSRGLGRRASRSPACRRGRACRARSRPPERATLLARDGEVLAEGSADGTQLPAGRARGVDRRACSSRRPEPADARRTSTRAASRATGRSGRTAWSGRSRVGWRACPAACSWRTDRVLARAEPRKARAVRTTIDTGLQEAAVAALAGRLGGIAALDPRTGEIRALAGIAFSAPQPPGSTFKIVTATAALEAGAVQARARRSRSSRRRPSTAWSSRTRTASSAAGRFRDSFAHSCNSVFAPLGREARRPAPRGRGRCATAGTRPRRCPARHRARSRRPRRSHARSRSAPPRSARARCWPPRSGWPPWRRRSASRGVRLEPTPRGRAARRAGPRDLATGGAHARPA